MPDPHRYSDELVGRSVGGGRFLLERLLGFGASGRVYLARQRHLDRRVAVKVIRRELASDPELAARFREEALLASRLNHPNIASVIDCSGPEDELAFIAMEYVAGKSLCRLIETEAPIGLDRVLSLLVQVLDGLEEAHGAGVVHADVKSPNIIVTRNRAGVEQPKLVDFGISVAGSRARVADGKLCGTPEYLAPEVIRGHRPTPSADIYGAGIVLFELIAGSPPFQGRSLGETLRLQLEEPIPHLPLTGDPVVDRLDAVVQRALAKNPDSRYRNARELRAALSATTPIAEGTRVRTILPRRWQRAAAVLPAIEVDHPPLEAVRERLREAIVAGDGDKVARGYLELAAALLRSGHSQVAVAELEEGVDVSLGLDLEGGDAIWRLQLALAAARAEAGDLDGAITVALRCLHQCQLSGATECCLSAHELLARFYATAGQASSATRHRATFERLERRSRAPARFVVEERTRIDPRRRGS